MQALVRKHFEWAREIGVNGTENITRSSYGFFLEFLIAGIYVFGVQGRISGVQDLRMSQLPELFSTEERAAYSRVFKNSATRLLQAIVMPEV